MRRTQRTMLGISCIAGGCAALVWMLSNSQYVGQFAPFLESYAAADETPATLTPEAETEESSQPTVTAEELRIAKTDAIHDADLAPKSRVVIPPGRPAWVEEDF